jgi:hypothetical protein
MIKWLLICLVQYFHILYIIHLADINIVYMIGR